MKHLSRANAERRIRDGRQVQLTHWIHLADPTPTASQRTLQDFEQARTAGNSRLRKPYAESILTPSLTDLAKSGRIPTPQKRDGAKWGTTSHAAADRRRAKGQSMDLTEIGGPGGPLNPDLHLWLMAWCPGFNALNPLETGRFRLWLRWHTGALKRLLAAAQSRA